MLKIDHLKKTYGSFTLDCSLEVYAGRVTGLIGLNGAGKSTTFKSILGLIKPDSGSITLFGRDVRTLTPADKQKLGVVLSDSGFSGYLTINDLLTFLPKFYEGFDSAFFRQKAAEYGLPFDKQIRHFSTGMKAKLKLLVAISHPAKLLLLDEPTVGLDVLARDELLDLLRSFLAEDEMRSVLISSHISSDLEGLCDDIYAIHQGRILLHEYTDRILSDYAVLHVTEAQYAALDKSYLLRRRAEHGTWQCLTDQKQFYIENAPDIVVDAGSIDSVLTLLTKGEVI